ncbi:tyrosine-protein phosphatase [Streptomyces roseolilacinus]|uniref:tyrosine-protein phosphatase n=1 Tax=Streptomyces roseolilacinus TaxID=66904 RepID=UPI0037F27B55
MERHVVFRRLHNFRDLGGYATGDGSTVRWGRLYRSDSLGKLGRPGGGDDWDRFLALGVRTVVDLRYPWEIERRGRVPEHPSFAYHNLSVEHRPYDQASLAPDVEVGPYLAERYLEVAEDGVEELRRALELVAADDSGPLVFHCASGKDRTGLLAALVLGLLGVDEDTVVADFALTELATERLVADWLANDPGRALVWPHFGRAPGEVMRRFLDGIGDRYGSLTGYATERLGVDDALVGALRRTLLEPAPAVSGG